MIIKLFIGNDGTKTISGAEDIISGHDHLELGLKHIDMLNDVDHKVSKKHELGPVNDVIFHIPEDHIPKEYNYINYIIYTKGECRIMEFFLFHGFICNDEGKTITKI